eukprot:GHRR01020197.1.p2 GENE.GHRR01020197.1~~GHRR01020197.1.p2  ORF type:complete len:104 (-),score=16.73 GHRR01020197.1:139-450(-)
MDLIHCLVEHLGDFYGHLGHRYGLGTDHKQWHLCAQMGTSSVSEHSTPMHHKKAAKCRLLTGTGAMKFKANMSCMQTMHLYMKAGKAAFRCYLPTAQQFILVL